MTQAEGAAGATSETGVKFFGEVAGASEAAPVEEGAAISSDESLFDRVNRAYRVREDQFYPKISEVAQGNF